MKTLPLPGPTKRTRITRSKLHAMGYRKGKDCYFKRRLCRKVRGFGPTTSVIIQVTPFNDDAHWARGEATIFHVNSREYPIKGAPTSIWYSGAEHSEAVSTAELRGWEEFAFCP